MHHLFSGVGVALATLFDESANVDVDATAEHAHRCAQAGVRAIVVAGSTGEAPALAPSERADLLRAVKERCPDVAVYAGTGAASAVQAVALTEAAVGGGADGLLVLSPVRSEDPSAYYATVVRAASGVPVLAYHYPAMAPPGLPVGEVAELGVDGIKDSSGDPNRLLALTVQYEGAVYTGSSALLVQARAIGCQGAILALANVEPERCIAAFAGDGDVQRELAAAHAAIGRNWPHGLKQLMAERFGTSPACRMG